jgi:ATP-dependent RNA helicase RhlE
LTFHEFPFDERLLDGLDAMGFEKATPIQEQAIPLILDNNDIIACAQTGTGKTAAFLLPVLNKILSSKNRHLNTLIITPTRELAIQIDQQIQGLGYFLGISSIAVYGGGDGDLFVQQRKALMEGAEIIVATPGRLISLLGSQQINFKNLEHLVLDEADRMLDMGFFQDIMKIIGYLPAQRQTLLFSATMPPKIRELTKKILREPKQISISISKPAEGILQQAYMVHSEHKVRLAKQLLKATDYKSIVIFASTKDSVKQLEKELLASGLSIKGFQSDLEQKEREDIMLAFKNKQLRVLVATDIISRGIDVDGIDLVINFDVPGDPEDYIHRIGRTARAESKGTAITFINQKDIYRFQNIEALMERTVDKLPLPEGFEAGPEYRSGGGSAVKRTTDFRKKTDSSSSNKDSKAPKKRFFKKKPTNNSSSSNRTS